MRMQIMDEVEAKKMLTKKRGTYQEIYDAVETLEPGKAIVLELESDKAAMRTASALSSARCYKNRKRKSVLENCYITKSGSIIVIGKN